MILPDLVKLLVFLKDGSSRPYLKHDLKRWVVGGHLLKVDPEYNLITREPQPKFKQRTLVQICTKVFLLKIFQTYYKIVYTINKQTINMKTTKSISVEQSDWDRFLSNKRLERISKFLTTRLYQRL